MRKLPLIGDQLPPIPDNDDPQAVVKPLSGLLGIDDSLVHLIIKRRDRSSRRPKPADNATQTKH